MHFTPIFAVAIAIVVAGPRPSVPARPGPPMSCPVVNGPCPAGTMLAGAAASVTLARFEPLIGGRWTAEGELGGGRRYTA